MSCIRLYVTMTTRQLATRDARARVACGDMMYSCSSQCMRGAIVF